MILRGWWKEREGFGYGKSKESWLKECLEVNVFEQCGISAVQIN